MHTPRLFEQNDPLKLKEHISCYPFATLISNTDAGLDATHIPFILNQSNDKDVLQAHIAKTNPLWEKLANKSEVLVVFNGPNCYVSPNFYPTKIETGRAVPTWNYVTVHIKGALSFIHDDDWILQMIDRLTTQQEAAQPSPWSVSDAPDEYIKKMLTAVVGIEIEVSSIVGQWKLSQNQPEKNKQGVVSGLSQEQGENSQKIAELVKTFTADNTG